MYRAEIAKSAARTIKKLPPKALAQISTIIDALEQNPRMHGAEKLSGGDFYRVRTGDYRVIYAIEDKKLIVVVVRVGDRKDVYRIDMKDLEQILARHRLDRP